MGSPRKRVEQPGAKWQGASQGSWCSQPSRASAASSLARGDIPEGKWPKAVPQCRVIGSARGADTTPPANAWLSKELALASFQLERKQRRAPGHRLGRHWPNAGIFSKITDTVCGLTAYIVY